MTKCIILYTYMYWWNWRLYVSKKGNILVENTYPLPEGARKSVRKHRLFCCLKTTKKKTAYGRL